MLDEIRKLLGKDWTDTLDLIRATLKSDIRLLDATNESILSSGGKRVRPMLSLLVARACGSFAGKALPKDSIRFAASSELLHNATLLHDDVADSSAQRRGVPTVMSILGGPASVLIGDYWLVRAMEIILASGMYGHKVIRIFAKTLSDLAEGEMLQLQKASSCDTTDEDYFRIIYSKTASLFEATGVSAAISVGASESVVEAVREYCVSLGIAFQIKDDIMDYSESHSIGKPVGADLKEGKITLPLLEALAAAGKAEDERVRDLVRNIPSNSDNIKEIRDFVLGWDGVGRAASRLEEYVRKAISALDSLPNSEEKDYLAKIAVFTASRDK